MPLVFFYPKSFGRHMELTILMPCLNEARTVASCVQKARLFLEQSGISGEVLIADNGSTDGSQAIAEEAGARVVQVSQKGYGAALIGGINGANGQYVIMGDSDDSYDFSDINGYLNELRSHADLVMGNRFRGHIEEGAMPFLHRYLGNPVLSWLGRLFFKTDIGDFHCGLRGFKKKSIVQLNLVTPGMEFASEMVAKAALAGLAIREVPTNLYRDGRGRPPHLRTWRDGWRHLLFMLLFSPRWLFVWPGMFLLCIGCSGLLTLTLSHATVAGVSLGIHSVLYSAAAAIVGLQFVQLGVLTKWIGVVAGIVPRPAWLPVSHPLLSIESGLLFGTGLFIAGLLWSLQITLDWRVAGFGALEPTQVMPLVIPAVTLMIAGIQIAAGSLFTGALNFSLRGYRKQS